MPPSGTTRLRTLIDVLRRPTVGLGMFATTLVFTGHFAFFTYLRPFLEQVAGVGVNGLSAILLGYGVANFVGTSLAGRVLEHRLRPMLIAMPALMVVLGIGLVALGRAPMIDAVLVALWGWLSAACRSHGRHGSRAPYPMKPSAGGLIVAAVQLAIATGAAAGGVMFDANGAAGVFVGAAVVLGHRGCDDRDGRAETSGESRVRGLTRDSCCRLRPGPQAETLRERHSIEISKACVRRIMIDAGHVRNFVFRA